MEHKRLFTFGCSFTNYLWPTWADMLGQDYIMFQNWGHPGLGNRAIAERVSEAHAKNKFTKDDIVIVQWTSHLRHDWLHFNHPRSDFSAWRTKGSIYSSENIKFYSKDWINVFWDEKAYFVHTLNHMLLTQGLLDSTGCTWYMTSMADQSKLSMEISDRTVNGEHPDEQGGFFHVWDQAPELVSYKNTIWDERQDHWILPILEICQKTPNDHYTFVYDKSNDKERKGLVENGRWLEPHPSISQHAEWLKLVNEKIDGVHDISDNQQKFIDQFQDLYSKDITFREFETRVKSTGWGVMPSYRGF